MYSSTAEIIKKWPWVDPELWQGQILPITQTKDFMERFEDFLSKIKMIKMMTLGWQSVFYGKIKFAF